MGAIQSGAKDLVERSRKGDQNARAILQKIKENASKGNPRAVEAKNACIQYAKENPHFSGDPKEIINMPLSKNGTRLIATGIATGVGALILGLPGALTFGGITFFVPQLKAYLKG
jgi:hypothetical protein